MEKEKEDQGTHNVPEGEAPQADIPSRVVKPEKVEPEVDVEDLRHKAEVSSQNFERAKKAEAQVKELQEKLEQLQVEDDYISTEGPSEDYGRLKSDLFEVKEKLAKAEVIEQYPALHSVWDEFNSFRDQDENKGLNIKTAAKAFMIEKELLEPARKGLEKSTGGDKGPTSQGMSDEDLKNLRENDFDKYRDMLKKGQIKFR